MITNLDSGYALILGLSIILFTGMIFGKLAKKIGIPNITGYLVGGLLIGPAILGLFNAHFSGVLGRDYIEALAVFASVELGFIAFGVGSEFKLSFLRTVGAMPVVIAFLESFFAVLLITLGMLAFGFPLPFALCLGAVGGATAPAATILVIKQYRAKGILARTTISVVALDDASALIFFGVAMALVRSIISPSANIALTLLMPFAEIILSLLLGALSGLLLVVGTRIFSSRANRLSLCVAAILLNIGICQLFQEVGNLGTISDPVHLSLSSLLACMMCGAVFNNLFRDAEKVMDSVESITPPLVIIFFVLSGADLQLASLQLVAVLILVIYLVTRIAGKIFGTWLGGKVTNAPAVVRKWLGMGLLPQGGIAIGLSVIVMKELPVSYHDTYNGMLVRVVVICAVFISELFGPICLKYALVKSGEATIAR